MCLIMVYCLFVIVHQCAMKGVVFTCSTMAMSKEHRQLLIRKRVELVQDMHISETLLSHLMATGIITADMKEQIEVGITCLLSC